MKKFIETNYGSIIHSIYEKDGFIEYIEKFNFNHPNCPIAVIGKPVKDSYCSYHKNISKEEFLMLYGSY